MVTSAMNQVQQITQALAPMVCMDLDATQLSFPFLFYLFAPHKDFREIFGIPPSLSMSMCFLP